MDKLAVPPRVKIAMEALISAADAGRRCPSNDELAFIMEASSPSSASNTIALLETMGLIRVYRGNCTRVVEIVASGQRTAGRITNVPWRQRANRKASTSMTQRYTYHGTTRNRVFVPAQPMPPVIERQPCDRCGARADLGCEHQPFWNAERDAELMDLVSDDLDFTQIGVVMGVHSESAAARFDMLRLQMGAQAA